MRKLFIWRCCAALAVVLAAAVGTVAGHDTDPSKSVLSDMPCLSVLVEDLYPDWAGLLTRKQLKDAAKVGLRAKMPRLSVTEDCHERLHVNLTGARVEGGSGNTLGFVFNLKVQVQRNATLDTGAFVPGAEVWHKGSLWLGPKGDAAEEVRAKLDAWITELASEYYDAGNP